VHRTTKNETNIGIWQRKKEMSEIASRLEIAQYEKTEARLYILHIPPNNILSQLLVDNTWIGRWIWIRVVFHHIGSWLDDDQWPGSVRHKEQEVDEDQSDKMEREDCRWGIIGASAKIWIWNELRIKIEKIDQTYGLYLIPKVLPMDSFLFDCFSCHMLLSYPTMGHLMM
jgi:hypothetical protein